MCVECLAEFRTVQSRHVIIGGNGGQGPAEMPGAW